MEKFKPSLSHLILEILNRPDYEPVKSHELARHLRLKTSEKRELRSTLRDLESEGRIVRLRKNRWALPSRGNRQNGILAVHPEGFGFVTPEETPGNDIFIPKGCLKNALHGDRVQVSVIQHPGVLRRRKHLGKSKELSHEGRILEVLERRNQSVVGLLRRTRYYWYVIPDNHRILPDIRVRDFASGLEEPKENEKVVIELEAWDNPAEPLYGQVVEDLGASDAPGVDVLSLMRDFALDEDFPAEAVEEARRCPAAPGPEDLSNRKDLRNQLAFTIDPEDAKDFDDAVSLARTPEGHWRLGVHIADVAHFVTPDSATDREANRRGTSVYLVDRVITMLPSYLTKEVCSLRPDTDRLTHTVEILYDDQGKVLDTASFLSVIRSSARLTYTAVQRFFDEKEDHGIVDPVQASLSDMRLLARTLRRNRIREGSLSFNLPEIKCILNESGEVTDIVKRVSGEAYQLIEEFMLAANRVVARKLAEAEIPSLYRIHDEPDEDQWAKMAASLAVLNVHVSPFSQADLNAIARNATGSPVEHTVNVMILRNLKRAVYAAELRPHFGLGFTHYTHFTSPIRRYPDLLVHRLLMALELGEAPPYPRTSLGQMAAHCTVMERSAAEAEEESVEIKRIAWFQSLLWKGEIGPYSGVIVSINPKGLIVELTETLQRGMIPFSAFTDDYYAVDEQRGRAVGRRHKKTWKLGTLVNVDLVRVDTSRRLVDFKVSGEESTAASGGKTKRRGRQRIK